VTYILITDFPNHWDNLPKSMTSYSLNLVKPKAFEDKLQPGTPTISIKPGLKVKKEK
jgi:hypothetical protein